METEAESSFYNKARSNFPKKGGGTVANLLRRMFGSELKIFLRLLESESSPEILGLEKVDRIHWVSMNYPCVHPALLEVIPDVLMSAYEKYGKMDDGRYAELLRKWEKEGIGGSLETSDGHWGSEWFPPLGAELFKLGECPYAEKKCILAYFVLIMYGKCYVLEQWTGHNSNHLRLLGGSQRPNCCFSSVIKEYLQ